jgi:3'-5' exoribonuclease
MDRTPLQYLQDVASENLPLKLRQTCSTVLHNRDFAFGMGGSVHHHNHPGGLVEHTMEVVSWILELASEQYNLPVLLTAAIWHDYHKLYEYEWDESTKTVKKLDYAKEVGHVVGSAMEFKKVAQTLLVDKPSEEQIVHCMLSHHGRREWGSPVEPKTPEAWLLHSADMLSSRGQKLSI